MGSRAAEGLAIEVDADGRRTETVFPHDDHYRLMIDAFGEAVLAGRPVPESPEDAVGNLRVCDAIAASHRTGRRQEL
jgi:predicted dehydrogenase